MSLMNSTLLPGDMWIGGDLPANLLGELAMLIDADHARPVVDESLDGMFRCKNLTEALMAAYVAVLAGREPIHINSTLVPWGEFPRVEAFCQANQLAFKRFSHPHSDGQTVRNGEIVIRHGWMASTALYTADVEGRIVFSYDDLRQTLIMDGLMNTGTAVEEFFANHGMVVDQPIAAFRLVPIPK